MVLLAGRAACAEPILGPNDVWPGFQYGLCDNYSVDLACLKAMGAPDGALRFIQAAAADPDIGVLVIPTRFVELGAVDLIEVEIPGMANTNGQQMLVNGDPSIVWLANWSSPNGYGEAVLRKYPQAFPAGRVVVQGHRVLPGGIQRFVMADMLVDGCRACDPVGSALFQLEFRDGAFLSFANLGWVLAEGEGSTAQMQADLRRGDIALLQTLLNLHGFQAWSMDGRMGPDTRTALDQFKAEHCLAGEADLSPRVIEALTAPDATFAMPPCSMALLPPLEAPLGLPDGRYVSDDRLCPPVSEEVQREFAERAYSMVVTLDRNRFSYGESGCTILSATPQGGDLDLGMTCQVEGMQEDRFETVTPLPPDAFRWRDTTFRRCDGALEPVATGEKPVFPLKDPAARLNAAFGAAGDGPVEDPQAYLPGQYHIGVDLRAVTGAEVFAPVDGTIVYYHRKNNSGIPSWLQTFVVLRDRQGRDWIFAHVECTICAQHELIDDFGVWSEAAQSDVRAGQVIGRIADLRPEGFGSHLHLGLATRPVIGPEGMLLPEYQSGKWASLEYDEGKTGARQAAAEQATALGFIDPMSLLRP